MPFFQQMVKLFLESRLTVTIHQLAVKFSCSHTENCIIGECSECSLAKLGSDNFNTRPSSKQFPEHADKPVKGITSLYLPTENDLIEPDDIEASPRIKCTLLIHINKRFLIGQSLSSNNFMGKKLVVIKKLLLMISNVVHVLKTICQQLKNDFNDQYVRFGSRATVSLIDNGRYN